MPDRRAEAEWDGNLREGRGRLSLESGAFQGPYSFRDRFEDGKNTNPEELLGAAHAGCFSMALAAGLTAAGHPPGHIHTTATVSLEREGDGFAITKIALATEADPPHQRRDGPERHRPREAISRVCDHRSSVRRSRGDGGRPGVFHRSLSAVRVPAGGLRRALCGEAGPAPQDPGEGA